MVYRKDLLLSLPTGVRSLLVPSLSLLHFAPPFFRTTRQLTERLEEARLQLTVYVLDNQLLEFKKKRKGLKRAMILTITQITKNARHYRAGVSAKKLIDSFLWVLTLSFFSALLNFLFVFFNDYSLHQSIIQLSMIIFSRAIF